MKGDTSKCMQQFYIIYQVFQWCFLRFVRFQFDLVSLDLNSTHTHTQHISSALSTELKVIMFHFAPKFATKKEFTRRLYIKSAITYETDRNKDTQTLQRTKHKSFIFMEINHFKPKQTNNQTNHINESFMIKNGLRSPTDRSFGKTFISIALWLSLIQT